MVLGTAIGVGIRRRGPGLGPRQRAAPHQAGRRRRGPGRRASGWSAACCSSGCSPACWPPSPLGGLGTAIHDSTVISAVAGPPAAQPAAHRPDRAVPRPAGLPPACSPASSPTSAPGSRDRRPRAVESAVEAASPSTLRIEGDGCGGRLTGSGFAVGPDLVVTNAHVVAGTDNIMVVDGQGRTPPLRSPSTPTRIWPCCGSRASTRAPPAGPRGRAEGHRRSDPRLPGRRWSQRVRGGRAAMRRRHDGRDIYNRDLTTPLDLRPPGRRSARQLGRSVRAARWPGGRGRVRPVAHR